MLNAKSAFAMIHTVDYELRFPTANVSRFGDRSYRSKSGLESPPTRGTMNCATTNAHTLIMGTNKKRC
ncbi:MAG: hypothetical protein OXM61_03030 [Candidatus Poribacteria bacterium]|nr:hypothetical protein [Candidatus Poribacteria bacterium]